MQIGYFQALYLMVITFMHTAWKCTSYYKLLNWFKCYRIIKHEWRQCYLWALPYTSNGTVNRDMPGAIPLYVRIICYIPFCSAFSFIGESDSWSFVAYSVYPIKQQLQWLWWCLLLCNKVYYCSTYTYIA